MTAEFGPAITSTPISGEVIEEPEAEALTIPLILGPFDVDVAISEIFDTRAGSLLSDAEVPRYAVDRQADQTGSLGQVHGHAGPRDPD